jgi:hypothetical protein
MASTQTTAEHYGRADLGTVILAALNAAGKNIDRLEPDDLATIDRYLGRHLHADGADDPAASLRLANFALTGSLLLTPPALVGLRGEVPATRSFYSG